MVSPVYIKPLLALLIIAAIIGVATVKIRNRAQGPTPVQSANQQLPQNIDIALKNARFSELQDGSVMWELVAERVDYDKVGNTAYLAGIKMEFQRTPSHGMITVTADTGEYFTTEKNVHLKGHVHVITEDGASFKTDTIKYTGNSAEFITNDPVVFRQQKMQLTAVGMALGVNNQQARFYSSVDASIIMN